MNAEQLAAARRLIALMDGDAVAQADANVYGNWYEHLTDHLSDIELEDE